MKIFANIIIIFITFAYYYIKLNKNNMFTKEEARETLVKKLGKDPAISERTINEIVDHSFKTLKREDMTLDDFVGLTYPILDTTNRNINNEVSTRLKKVQPPAPDPIPQPQPTSGLTKDDVVALFKEMGIDKIPTLSSELETIRAEQAIKNNLTLGIEKFKSFNPDESRKAAIDLAIKYAKGRVTKDDTPDTVAEKIKEHYNEFTSSFGVSGFKPASSTPEDVAKQKEKAIAEIKERVKANKFIN